MPQGSLNLTISVSILGASGYAGGELLRLLLDHPHVDVAQVTSERNAGSFVHFTHPNLRGRTKLKFVSAAELEPCDLLVLGLPHGGAMGRIAEFAALAGRIIDLSADFRLRDAQAYVDWYGKVHAAPSWLDQFVYGLPELYRQQIRGARYVSGVGCNATADGTGGVAAVRGRAGRCAARSDLRGKSRQQRGRQPRRRLNAPPGAGAGDAQLRADGTPAYC